MFFFLLAASTNFSIWQATCRAFAKQLEDNSDPVKASSYYLMVHDVDKAVQCLIEANFFQAALIIIKTRYVFLYFIFRKNFKLVKHFFP